MGLCSNICPSYLIQWVQYWMYNQQLQSMEINNGYRGGWCKSQLIWRDTVKRPQRSRTEQLWVEENDAEMSFENTERLWCGPPHNESRGRSVIQLMRVPHPGRLQQGPHSRAMSRRSLPPSACSTLLHRPRSAGRPQAAAWSAAPSTGAGPWRDWAAWTTWRHSGGCLHATHTPHQLKHIALPASTEILHSLHWLKHCTLHRLIHIALTALTETLHSLHRLNHIALTALAETVHSLYWLKHCTPCINCNIFYSLHWLKDIALNALTETLHPLHQLKHMALNA